MNGQKLIGKELKVDWAFKKPTQAERESESK
jgi:hypothetical protein